MHPAPASSLLRTRDALVREAIDGSDASLGELLESFRPFLLLFARSKLGDDLRRKAGGSDLVQETFLAAKKGLAGFRGERAEDLFRWLVGILNNRIINLARDHRSTGKRDLSLEQPLDLTNPALLVDAGAPPHARIQGDDEAARLRRAIDRLPVASRRVVEMRAIEGLSFEEIAAGLGKSEAAVRKAWLRSLERLEELLEENH